MSGLVYLAALLAGIGCMLAIDWRFTLFFWRNAPAAALVVTFAVLALMFADLEGIELGLFVRGGSSLATGILLAPHLPIEEPVFLVFLVLTTAVAYTGAARIMARREVDVRA